MFLGADDERFAFALGQRFLAIWAHGVTGEAIPRTTGGLAAAARRSRSQLLLNDAQPVHRQPSRSPHSAKFHALGFHHLFYVGNPPDVL
jgi:hypothetical protein